jgi:hypothetical protein
MRSLVLCFAAALVLSGCAASSESSQDDEASVGEADEALTAYGKSLIGAWSVLPDYSLDLHHLVLKGDGTFIWHHDIKCFTTPCLTRDEGKWIAYKPAPGTVQGRIRLIGKEEVRQYVVVKGYDGTIKLARKGMTAKLENVTNWCEQPTDCSGQLNTIAIKCAGGYKAVDVCTESNACSKTCEPDCRPTGCGGQICADKSVFSTCVYRPEYACYKTATCERNAAGSCAWRSTPELTKCLAGGGTTCDYSDPNKDYIEKDPAKCAAILFLCVEGKTPFFGDCGCGCENITK